MNRRRNRRRLQELLRELFQFDVSELDFGIYRILNQRREEIDRFIERHLLEAVEEELDALAVAGRAQVEQRLEEKRKQLGEDAFQADGSLKEGALTTNLGREYQELKEELEAAEVAEETEARIFNDLYRFFARYYREGDFLTERRYSSREPKYAVPYNGEEVLLHWANRDQYYVKTTERFSDYQFRVDGDRVVFRLERAQTAQDDVQGETRHFLLADAEPLRLNGNSGGLAVRFAYRVLGDEDEQEILGRYNADRSKSDQRKRLDRSIVVEALAEEILERLEELGATDLRTRLATPEREGKERSRLESHLDRYTARHKMDYFIHKDLGGFLRRELDFFLKNEVLNLDDFSGPPGTEAFEQATLRMQVIRRIADRVIEFLAQIEDFQERLFEKKKFVVDTQYCVTLDRVPEELYEEILANEEQLDVWRKLYAIDEWEEDLFQQSEEINRAFLEAYPYLMVDTAYFEESFTDQLLASFENLESATDGLLIHGENFQALNLLQEKYRETIDCVYIDPPYNTGNDEFVYKDNYQHSSWLSMIRDRVLRCQRLMIQGGAFFSSIDDNEVTRLRQLMFSIFRQEQEAGLLIVRTNPRGRTLDRYIAKTHEYIVAFVNGHDETAIHELPKPERMLEEYRHEDEKGRYRELGLRNRNPMFDRSNRPNLFYPIYIDPKSGEVSLEKSDRCSIKALPRNSRGEDGCWTWSEEKVRNNRELLVGRQVNTGAWRVYRKDYMRDEAGQMPTTMPKSIWLDKAFNNQRGKEVLRDLIGEHTVDFPKSPALLERVVQLGAGLESYVLDYFAGSGTTGHAVMKLNREDGGDRKYILVEMGEYFDTVLRPRLMKVAFSSEWKDGVPQNRQGMSHLIKYQRLESYEDTLNNLELSQPGDAQVDLYEEFDDYLLRYMLDVESRGSPSLLDEETFEHPFEYQLKIQQGLESPRPTTVDLVESFHYLLGIEVATRRVKEHQERRYVVTWGRRETEEGYERVLTIWRDREGLDLEEEAQWSKNLLDEERPDRVYTNGPSYIPDAQPLEIPFREAMMGVNSGS